MCNCKNNLSKEEAKTWFKTSKVEDFPVNGGAGILYKDNQIAVFNFSEKNEWYATDNLCPHKRQMILAKGITGEEEGILKVACPFHKNTYSLIDGKNINGDEDSIATYPVKIEDGYVYIGVE